MKIIPSKDFLKQYEKLQSSDKEKVEKSLRFFLSNPFDKSLCNHALRGQLSGKRSISAGFDLRIIFETTDKYLLVILLAVGKHNQLY